MNRKLLIGMVLSLAGLILVSANATAQGTVNDRACGIGNDLIANNGEDHLRLQTSDSCNTMSLIDNIDYRSTPTDSLWENTTWFSGDGTRRDAFLQGFDTGDDTATPTWTITVRTLTFDHIDMQPQTDLSQEQRFGFAGSAIGLTLINGSVDLSEQPLWTSASPLTISAPSGTNTIHELSGNQGPPTTIEVADGSSLQIANGGCLGPGCASDATRLNFFTSPNAADIAGTLDIFRSHVIFPTGDNEILVRDTGELLISGSNNTELETGTVTVDGGSLTLGTGGNFLEADTLNFNNATVTFGDNAEILTGFAQFTGTNTMFLGNAGGFSTNFQVKATGGVVLLGSTLTLSGAEEFRTPRLEMLSGPTLEITESADLVITPSNTLSLWASGSVDIAADAILVIQSGGALGSSITINNEGNIRVEGKYLPEGTMTGTGDLNVIGGGTLGTLGGDANEMFTTSAAVTMDDNSRFRIFLNPTQVAAQQLVADGGFSLGSNAGVFLQVDVFDDVVLPLGTKFPIVNYADGNNIGGRFMRLDYTPLNEGDLIGFGMNTFRISYADPDYGDDSSVITLTVADPDTTHARFYVSKSYSDSNTTPVDVTLTCNGGLPLEQTFTISPGNPVNFTLTNVGSDSLRCEVTESGSPEGYVSSFWNHDAISDTSCVFDTVHGGNVYACEITNTAGNALFNVTKNWVLTDGGPGAYDLDVEIDVVCSADIVAVDGQPVADPDGTYTVTLGDGESSSMEVDTTGGPASCTATETVTQSGVEPSSEGCTDVTLTAGASADCTVTNTVFFEGIPTLNQFGMALMALLMLGVGFIGMRRFA